MPPLLKLRQNCMHAYTKARVKVLQMGHVAQGSWTAPAGPHHFLERLAIVDSEAVRGAAREAASILVETDHQNLVRGLHAACRYRCEPGQLLEAVGLVSSELQLACTVT